MNIIDYLDKVMDNSQQINLNKILKCKSLDNDSKEKCFKILLYLINNHGNIINWNLVLDRFSSFCINKKNNHKKSFMDIINYIQESINNIDENNFSHKTNLDILLLKISSVIKMFNTNFNDNELKVYISKLMESNLSYKNYELINIISDKMPDNSKKRDILFNILLSEEVTAYANWGRTYENVLNVLNNDKVLRLNNDYYEKVIKLTINYVHSLTLNDIFNNKKMSDKKKEYSIDYLLELMNKYMEQYSQYRLFADEIAYDMMRKPIFNVLNNPNMLRMSNSRFKLSLDGIVSSKNPNAYATFVAGAGNNLSKEKYDIACKYIEDSDKKENYYEIDYEDKKRYVAEAAVGSVMKDVSVDTFSVILSLMDIDVSKDNKNLNCVKDDICRLVNKKELFVNNEGRLLFVINKIINNPDRATEILMFANSKNSLYYSDSEYERIINMIISMPKLNPLEYQEMTNIYLSNIHNRVYAIIDLFTNDNVEFIGDKEYLFNIAKKNTSIIKNITNEFNKIGQQNQNMKKIFNGVSDDTYEKITGKIRKLSQ